MYLQYIIIYILGRKWWMGRVGNCPPRFWQNRRRAAAGPPSFRYLFTPLYIQKSFDIQCESIPVLGTYIYILGRGPKYCSHWMEQQNYQQISSCLNSKLVFNHNLTQLTKLSKKLKVTAANFFGTHFFTDLAHECDSHLKVFIHRVGYEYKKLSASCSKTY